MSREIITRPNPGRWPHAMGHLENSKLSPLTTAWKIDSIRRFVEDPDAIVESSQSRRLYPGAPRRAISPGRVWSGGSIWKAMRTRRSTRVFARRPVEWATLSRLVQGAAGITGEIPVPGVESVVQHLRAWPSGGALYPIELYVAILDGPEAGLWHHDPGEGCLERIEEGPLRERVAPHILTFSREMDAPLLFLLTGVPERTMRKYGERGYRFLWIEAGHLAQNLLLAATALGLATCPLGGFHEDELVRLLGIDSRETLLYVIAVGKAAK